jgi:hypothetical protein
VSEDWTNLTNGVQSFQQEHESKVVCALISELNGFLNLGLGSEPGFDRMNEGEAVPEKPRILMIGSSHVVREADILADRGYEVTLVSKPGWRATKGAVDEMMEKIKEAMVNLTPRDIVVIQFLDNVSYSTWQDRRREEISRFGGTLMGNFTSEAGREGEAVHDVPEHRADTEAAEGEAGLCAHSHAKIPARKLL